MSRIDTKLGSTNKARIGTGLTVWASLVALTVLAALPVQRLGEQVDNVTPREPHLSVGEDSLRTDDHRPANPKAPDMLVQPENN